MPQPIVNPDGTVQVSPPLASAFAPQAGQPPPPMQVPPQVGAGQQASPGVSGAILDAIKAIAGALAPKGLTQRKATIDNAVDDASK